MKLRAVWNVTIDISFPCVNRRRIFRVLYGDGPASVVDENVQLAAHLHVLDGVFTSFSAAFVSSSCASDNVRVAAYHAHRCIYSLVYI